MILTSYKTLAVKNHNGLRRFLTEYDYLGCWYVARLLYNQEIRQTTTAISQAPLISYIKVKRSPLYNVAYKDNSHDKLRFMP